MRPVNSYVAVHTRRFESIRITAIHGDSESMIGLDPFFHQSRRVSRPYETTCDHIWPHTTTYDHIRTHMTTYDHIRPYMTTYEHIWPHGGTYDHMRPHETALEHIRPHTNTCDHIRPHANTCNHIQPHTTTCDHIRPHGGTYDHMRPLYDHLRTHTVLFRVVYQIWEQMSKTTKFRSSRISWMHP